MPRPNSTALRWLVLTLWLFTAGASPSSAETVLILHPGLESEDLSANGLLRVYAMKKRTWSDGTPIVVYTLPNKSEVHRDFVNSYLKMQPHHLNRLWHKLVFSGTGTRPEVVNSPEEMLEMVAKTPGAIGYLDSAEVNIASQSVITVTSHE